MTGLNAGFLIYYSDLERILTIQNRITACYEPRYGKEYCAMNAKKKFGMRSLVKYKIDAPVVYKKWPKRFILRRVNYDIPLLQFVKTLNIDCSPFLEEILANFSTPRTGIADVVVEATNEFPRLSNSQIFLRLSRQQTRRFAEAHDFFYLAKNIAERYYKNPDRYVPPLFGLPREIKYRGHGYIVHLYEPHLTKRLAFREHRVGPPWGEQEQIVLALTMPVPHII